MTDGFLGYRTSFMLDAVVCALVLVVPILLYSLYVVKVQRKYALHRKLQLLIGVLLLIAVGAFEIDMQWVQGGWENVVGKRDVTTGELDHIRTVLRIHLVFAISTPIVWAYTMTRALQRFGREPQPGSYSRSHRCWGWISTIDLVLTSVTGLWFYYVAFIQPTG